MGFLALLVPRVVHQAFDAAAPPSHPSPSFLAPLGPGTVPWMRPRSSTSPSCEAAHAAHRLYRCALCNRQVKICRQCDRGNQYCSSECAASVRRERVHQAGQRYQRTEQGRKQHQGRQQRYRQRQQEGAVAASTRLGIQQPSSTSSERMAQIAQAVQPPSQSYDAPAPSQPRCDLCGCECSPFVRLNSIRSRRRRRPWRVALT